MQENFGFGIFIRWVGTQATVGAKKLHTKLIQNDQALQKVSKRANKATGSMASFTRVTARAAVAGGRAEGRLRNVGVQLARLAKRSNQAAGATSILGRAIKGLTIFLGFRMLYGAITSVSRISREFEQTMVDVATIVDGATGPAVMALEREARRLGATTAYTARESADAMKVLAESGKTTNQIIGMTESVLNLAAVGNINLARSAQILSAILSQYNLKASDTADITNSLAAAAVSSQQTVSRLEQSFVHVGPVASKVGMTVKDTAAALGVLGNAGIFGSRAGVAFRNVLTKLQVPTKKLTTLLKQHGIAYDEVNPKTNDAITVLSKLENIFSDTAAAYQIFGLRTAAQGTALFDAFTKSMERMRERMGRALSAAEIYELRMSTVGGAMKIAKSRAEDVAIELGQLFRPARLEVAKRLAGFFERLGLFLKRMKPALDVVVRALTRFFSALADNIEKAISRILGSAHELTRAASLTQDSIMGIVGPLGVWLYLVSKRISSFFEGFAEGFGVAADVFATVLTGVMKKLGKFGDALLEWFGISDEGTDKMKLFGKAVGFVVGAMFFFGLTKMLLVIPQAIIMSFVSFANVAIGALWRVASWIVILATKGYGLLMAAMIKLRIVQQWYLWDLIKEKILLISNRYQYMLMRIDILRMRNAGKLAALTQLKYWGLVNKLFRAGLIVAAFGVGYAIGTWADKKWNISGQLLDWISKTKWLRNIIYDIVSAFGGEKIAKGYEAASKVKRSKHRGLSGRPEMVAPKKGQKAAPGPAPKPWETSIYAMESIPGLPAMPGFAEAGGAQPPKMAMPYLYGIGEEIVSKKRAAGKLAPGAEGGRGAPSIQMTFEPGAFAFDPEGMNAENIGKMLTGEMAEKLAIMNEEKGM